MPVRLLIILFALLTACGSVSACSCVEVGDPNPPPCARINPADVIFVGTVVEIENPAYEVSTENPQVLLTRYRFRIDETISKLEGEKEIDVYSGRGGADCSYHFEKGKQYLVFSYRGTESPHLFATICSPTLPVANAQFLLPQLRAARDRDSVASVYGRIQIGQRPYLSVTNVEPRPLQHALIQLQDSVHVFESTTDSNGDFSIYSVPPGEYRLTAELPRNVELARPLSSGPPPPIKLTAGDCSEYNVMALPTARIRGRVLDQHGKPLKYADVILFSPEEYQASPLLMEWRSVQHDSGFFEFAHVAPGDYILVYNNGGLTAGSSGSRCFYPGESDIARAKRIHVEAGQEILNANIAIRRGCPQR